MMNFENVKNVKDAAKTDVLANIVATLVEVYGEENVSRVGTTEYAVAVGAKDGNEVVVNIKPTSKDFENRKTSKKEFVAYDRLAAAADFDAKEVEKAKKKEDAKEAKKNKEEVGNSDVDDTF